MNLPIVLRRLEPSFRTGRSVCSRLFWAGGTAIVALAVASIPGTAQSLGTGSERESRESADRLTVDRYLDWESVADPRISPDGSDIVYVRRWVDPMTDTWRSALWIVNSDGSRNRYLAEGREPRWSPSGDRLAFLECGTAGGGPIAPGSCGDKGVEQINVRIMHGAGAGTITQVTRLTESASNIAWSPDGRLIAFNMLVPKKQRWDIELPERPDGARWIPDPLVIDRMHYRQDRTGFLREGYGHIFVVRTDGGTPRQITDGDFSHGAPKWSPDGRTVVFEGLRIENAEYRWEGGGYIGRPSDIYAVDIGTREIPELVTRNGPDRNPVVSPDGRLIAYTGFDSTSYTYLTEGLYVVGSDGSEPHLISGSFDRTPKRLMWSPDGKRVYFSADDEGTEDLYYAAVAGGVKRVTRGQHILEVTQITDQGLAVGVLSGPNRPGDVVIFSLDDPEPRYLTDVNGDVLGGVRVGEVEEIWYESVDGLRIQGWIVKPPDFDPSRKYPLILRIHGGPHGMYDFGFSFEYQNYAANGYVVLYTNPRGSSGYGTQFGNAINNAYPGMDFDDLMAGVDEVIGRGYIDTESLFVTGCSGGGVLSSWVVGHTDRFAGAMVRCPVTNWLTFVGTVDTQPGWYYNFEKFPWEDPSEHLRRSPIMYVGNVTTPTLLVTGVRDLRTPMPQSAEFYQALKILGVPTKLIGMVDEWHSNSKHPSNFMRIQLYGMKWFEQYMSTEMKGRFVASH